MNSLRLCVSFVGSSENCWTPWFQSFISLLLLLSLVFMFFSFCLTFSLAIFMLIFYKEHLIIVCHNLLTLSLSFPSYPPPSHFLSSFYCSRLLTLRHHSFINFLTLTRNHWSASTKDCFVCYVLNPTPQNAWLDVYFRFVGAPASSWLRNVRPDFSPLLHSQVSSFHDE